MKRLAAVVLCIFAPLPVGAFLADSETTTVGTVTAASVGTDGVRGVGGRRR